MPIRIIAALCLFALMNIAAQAAVDFSSLTVGGITYSNISILNVGQTDLYFQHATGVANVKLRLLGKDLQKKFGYDPELAAKIEQQRDAETEVYSRQAAEVFAQRVAERRAAAEAAERAAAEPPFTLADPLTGKSPLNQPAPKFTVKIWFDEKPPTLAGKFGLLYFWNSKSIPCQQAIPSLNELSKKFPETLIVMAVTTETEKEITPPPHPINFYSGSEPAAKTAIALGLSTVPAVALIDPKGIVRYAGHPAALTEEALGKLMTRFGEEQ